MGRGEGSTVRKFIVCTVHLRVRVIKSRRLGCADHVARMEESRSAFKILEGKEKLDIDGRSILECNLKKYVSMEGIGLNYLRTGIVGEPL